MKKSIPCFPFPIALYYSLRKEFVKGFIWFGVRRKTADIASQTKNLSFSLILYSFHS